jgi:hypothetical protein
MTLNNMSSQKLVFKKGISTIHIPFMLHDFSPWQEQVVNEMKKCKERFVVRKSAYWSFEITGDGAVIKCHKK